MATAQQQQLSALVVPPYREMVCVIYKSEDRENTNINSLYGFDLQSSDPVGFSAWLHTDGRFSHCPSGQRLSPRGSRLLLKSSVCIVPAGTEVFLLVCSEHSDRVTSPAPPHACQFLTCSQPVQIFYFFYFLRL